MAIYYLGMKTFGRNGGKRGSRATSAAAYRSGERIRDERTGAVYDHHRRRDVLHKEIVLPAKLARAGRELDWARDRGRLWNAAEHAEGRANARVAREFVVALPHELTHGQRKLLTRQFAQELAERYGNAIDVAIHAPRGDPRNFHAHLLATTREITPDGLGPKTTLERSGTERHRLGLPRWREETAAIRERWAELTNRALEREHVAARVAPASFTAERGERVSARLPFVAYRIEQRGGHSFVAERIRAEREQGFAREPMGSGERPTVVQQIWAKARERWIALTASRRGPGLGESARSPPERGEASLAHPSTLAQRSTGRSNVREPFATPQSARERSIERDGSRAGWSNEAEKAAFEWARQYRSATVERSRLRSHVALERDQVSELERDRASDLKRDRERQQEHERGYDYEMDP